MKQQVFKNFTSGSKFRHSYGGTLRKSSKGRGARPLSTRDPIHLVFKVNKVAIRGGLRGPKQFTLLNSLLKKYARRFFVKVEQCSIQTDHIHLLLRAGKRAQLQSFFKVVAGQFAQILTGTRHNKHEGVRVWKYRPFTRIVKGFKAYQIVRNYIQLNEKEAQGRPYSKSRLRGMTSEQLRELWS